MLKQKFLLIDKFVLVNLEVDRERFILEVNSIMVFVIIMSMLGCILYMWINTILYFRVP